MKVPVSPVGVRLNDGEPFLLLVMVGLAYPLIDPAVMVYVVPPVAGITSKLELADPVNAPG